MHMAEGTAWTRCGRTPGAGVAAADATRGAAGAARCSHRNTPLEKNMGGERERERALALVETSTRVRKGYDRN